MIEEPSTIEMLRTLLQEVADYARNLARMFAAELSEKSRSLRYLGIMAGGAALFLVCGFLFLSGALIGAIAYGLASWRWALLIVGVGYSFIGMFMLMPVAHALRSGLLSFDHTKRRMREDAEWIKHKMAA